MGAFSIALGRTFFNLQKIRREVYIFFRYSNKKRVLRVAKPIKVICSIPIGKNRFNNIKSYIFIKKTNTVQKRRVAKDIKKISGVTIAVAPLSPFLRTFLIAYFIH